jgi:hypothetical protein
MRRDRHSPLLEPRQSVRRSLGELQRHTQYRPRAVGQETTEVDVPALTNPAEVPACSRGRFARRQSEPAGEVTPAPERMNMNMTDRAHERRRRQDADARDRLEPRCDRMRVRNMRQLTIELRDLLLESVHFVDDQRDRVTQHIGYGRVRVSEDSGDSTEHHSRADRDSMAVFGQQSSNRVDSSDTRRLPLRPHAWIAWIVCPRS